MDAQHGSVYSYPVKRVSKEDAGFKADEVKITKCERDEDDGIWQFEIEIKTTDEMNVNEHFRAGILGVDGKLPPQYEYQVRHYMAITGLSRFIVLVCYGFDSSKVIPVTVYRDLSFEEQMLGMEIRDVAEICIRGMQEHAEELGLRKPE